MNINRSLSDAYPSPSNVHPFRLPFSYSFSQSKLTMLIIIPKNLLSSFPPQPTFLIVVLPL